MTFSKQKKLFTNLSTKHTILSITEEYFFYFQIK